MTMAEVLKEVVEVLRHGTEEERYDLAQKISMWLAMGGVEKPTVEQVAWVFRNLVDQLKEPGTFRYLVYDRMGFGPGAYGSLYDAGGMFITNELGGGCRIIGKVKYKAYKLKVKIKDWIGH